MNRDIERYTADYIAHYGFEGVLVAYRRKLVIERLCALRPAVVLEVGCGSELLYGHYLKQANPVSSWTIVEPARTWSDQARAAQLPGLSVVEGFLENSVEFVREALPRPPDMVICSGVLQEVPSAATLLEAMRSLMDVSSLLHINVANAKSFHRRLALAMGLIPALETISERNIRFQQHRVYDFDSLSADLARARLAITDKGGYLIKPFTHTQMESLAPALGETILDGLFELGRCEPEWACEIYVEARRA